MMQTIALLVLPIIGGGVLFALHMADKPYVIDHLRHLWIGNFFPRIKGNAGYSLSFGGILIAIYYPSVNAVEDLVNKGSISVADGLMLIYLCMAVMAVGCLLIGASVTAVYGKRDRR